MALDISASTIKRRASGMIFEKIGSVAKLGMLAGGVVFALMAWRSAGDVVEHFSFDEVSATVVEVQPYCKFMKLKLGGENKGFKSSDDMACDEAYALADTPEFGNFKLFEKSKYLFAYTDTAGLAHETTISKTAYGLEGNEGFAAGDTASLLIDPSAPENAVSPNRKIFTGVGGLFGGLALLLFLLSFAVWRGVRNRY